MMGDEARDTFGVCFSGVLKSAFVSQSAVLFFLRKTGDVRLRISRIGLFGQSSEFI